MSTRANRAVTARGVELTRFTKVGGPLTKRILLAPDGKLVSGDIFVAIKDYIGRMGARPSVAKVKARDAGLVAAQAA